MIEWPWQNATTLAERAKWKRARTASATLEPVTERGRKRLAKWKSQPPFDSTDLFQRRLSQAGLSEAELLELLSRPVHATPEGISEPPAWAVEVAAALDGSEKTELCVGV